MSVVVYSSKRMEILRQDSQGGALYILAVNATCTGFTRDEMLDVAVKILADQPKEPEKHNDKS